MAKILLILTSWNHVSVGIYSGRRGVSHVARVVQLFGGVREVHGVGTGWSGSRGVASGSVDTQVWRGLGPKNPGWTSGRRATGCDQRRSR